MTAKVIVLLILVLVGEQSSNAQTPAVPPKPAPPKPAASKPKPAKQQVKPASTPLQLEDVIFLLQGLAAKLGAEDTVLLAIKTRGLGFRATREAIDRIDANSPPPAVRALLLELMGPLPPPPVVAPKTGTFSISCVPAECELSMNGKDLGRTTGGKFVVKDEPFGPKVLQAVRSGYISDQRKVDLVAGMVPSVEFKLEPTGETKQAFGKQILGAMRSKLGMEEPGSCDLTASGSTSVYTENRGSADYNIRAAFGPPMLAYFDVGNTQGQFALRCRGENCSQRKSEARLLGLGGRSTRMAAEAASAAETNLRLFRRNHVCGLLDQISASGVRASALSENSREIEFVASDGSFLVSLNDDGLPATADYKSAAGVGGGLRVTYSDYVDVGKSKYPRRTVVGFLEGVKTGIQVRFDTVQPGGNLQEKDFR